jgi:hypothetical protein
MYGQSKLINQGEIVKVEVLLSYPYIEGEGTDGGWNYRPVPLAGRLLIDNRFFDAW